MGKYGYLVLIDRENFSLRQDNLEIELASMRAKKFKPLENTSPPLLNVKIEVANIFF